MHYRLVRQLNCLLRVHQKYVRTSHALACNPLRAHDPPCAWLRGNNGPLGLLTAPAGPMRFASAVDLRDGMATRNGARPCPIIFVPSWPRSLCPFTLPRSLCPVHFCPIHFDPFILRYSPPSFCPAHEAARANTPPRRSERASEKRAAHGNIRSHRCLWRLCALSSNTP
jgi:hypothetical protein